MRWLLDEMLPRTLAQRLTKLDHDALSVHDLELVGASDNDVFDFAVLQERLIVTENFADFARLLDERQHVAHDAYRSSSFASRGFLEEAASPLTWRSIWTSGHATIRTPTSVHIGRSVRGMDQGTR